MRKIFISQPMRGRKEEEILKERKDIIEWAKKEYGDVEILESYFDDFAPDAKPLEYLARSLMFLAKADLAIFANNWFETRGCMIEHACAVKYEIEVKYF